MDKDDILAKLAAGEITKEQASQMLEEVTRIPRVRSTAKSARRAPSASTDCSACRSRSMLNSGSDCWTSATRSAPSYSSTMPS